MCPPDPKAGGGRRGRCRRGRCRRGRCRRDFSCRPIPTAQNAALKRQPILQLNPAKDRALQAHPVAPRTRKAALPLVGHAVAARRARPRYLHVAAQVHAVGRLAGDPGFALPAMQTNARFLGAAVVGNAVSRFGRVAKRRPGCDFRRRAIVMDSRLLAPKAASDAALQVRILRAGFPLHVGVWRHRP